MDEVNSLHYDETPKAKFMRYIIWGAVAVFIITVTIIALVKGLGGSGPQGYAFLGITCFLFTLTTYFLQYKIIQQDLSDAARIPVYLQLAFSVFFGISLLITVYSDWNPSELDCYYEKPGTFVRKIHSPACWNPPNCFHQQTQCLMYIGVIGDRCATNTMYRNASNGWQTYTCAYTYKPPTPPPTTPPPSTLALESGKQTYDAFETAEKYDKKSDIKQKPNDLLSHLRSYYPQNKKRNITDKKEE
eukprot:UN10609